VKELYEALRCPKDYVLFTAEEGVRAFCRDGRQPESPVFWNPDTRLFEATVVRRNGLDLVIRNLPLLTANYFRKALTDALRERYT
jgi:hypothetical protein